jgi:hypothetical protein
MGATVRIGIFGSAHWSGALPARARRGLLPAAAAAMLPSLSAAGRPQGLPGVLVPAAACAASLAAGKVLSAAAAESVRTACSHGSTSGTDALTGFC